MIAPTGRIVAAMSGGVDSSVAAALLLEQGFEVIGVTLRMQEACEGTAGDEACCGADSVAQARAAADHLGIAHKVLDCREPFEKSVLLRSWQEYRRGRTPNPCVMCNREIKFGVLLDYAQTLGAQKIATGHYARLGVAKNDRGFILRGVDHRKDQSYFLFAVDSGNLSKVLFPLGRYLKEEVRAMARRIGLGNADRVESQDSCFATKQTGFAETLRQRFAQGAAPGPILDETGRKLGVHEGIHLFTIGQRRGIGVSLGVPVWVKSIDPQSCAVSLTTAKENLAARALMATGVVWQSLVPRSRPLRCSVQVRYNQAPVPAIVELIEPGRVLVNFERFVTAVCPGQAAVFYSGPRLLGGAWIDQSFSRPVTISEVAGEIIE
ncbi:MAG: tRNA 2-thiouridine(34) synthase MnmA [Syntrophobacteraceae bacterium]